MRIKMTSIDTEVLYGGTLYYGEHNTTATYNLRLKKGPVSLSRTCFRQADGREVQKFYSLSTGKKVYRFKAENVIFFDKEDTEYPVKKSELLTCWSRRHRRRSYTPFTVISLVFLDDKQSGGSFRQAISISLQQNQRESILIEQDEKIQNLMQILEAEFGSVVSSFVGCKDGTRFDLRLAITKHNFSLLDPKLKNIEYFHFSSLNAIGVSFNPWTNLLVLAIQEPCDMSHTEFFTTRNIEVKTENGELIRNLLSKHVSIYAMPHLCNEPQEHTAASSIALVESWIQNSCRRSGEEGSMSFSSSPFQSFSDPIKPELSSLDEENNNSDPLRLPESPSDLPPPSPCTNQASTFTPPLNLPRPCSRRVPIFSPEDFKDLPKLPKQALPRCQSIGDELNRDLSEHLYVNNSVRDSHSQDDQIYYYRFYMNQGHVKVKRSKMKFKMQRRSRLSDDLGNIDFEAVDLHEKYMEKVFSSRSDDPKYQRLAKQRIYSYIPLSEVPVLLNIPPDAEAQKEDDPYWKSNLCLFIQSMFQQRKPPNIYHKFDLTQGQYAHLAVHLDVTSSLHIKRKDWTDFAAWIGIKSAKDIEVIRHFSFSYKYLAMDLVLGYWCFQAERKGNVPPCTFDQLRNIIIQIEREDILQILTHTDTNPEEDEFSDEDNETYL